MCQVLHLCSSILFFNNRKIQCKTIINKWQILRQRRVLYKNTENTLLKGRDTYICIKNHYK